MAMLLAKHGRTKADHLEWLELPPGMGGGHPIAADAHRYCGTLTLGPGDAFNFHHHPKQDEVIYVVDGSMEAWIGKDKALPGNGDVMVVPKGTRASTRRPIRCACSSC